MTEMKAPEPEASTSSTNEAAIFKRLHPRSYLRRFIAEGLRPPDGRDFAQFRSTSINTGSITTANGSALVRLGQTAVVCGVRVEVAEPDVLRPKNGFVVPNLELPPMCSAKFRPGPPNDEAQVINDRVHKILQACVSFARKSGGQGVMTHRANLIPLRSLCIEPGKAVYVIYLDMVCINYDGNLVDAAVLAANAALRDTRIPTAIWDEDEQAAAEDSSSPPRALQLNPVVLSASFGVFEGSTIMTDVDAFEESLCAGRITIALEESGTIRHVWQAGNFADSPSVLQQCLSNARQRLKAQLTLLSSG